MPMRILMCPPQYYGTDYGINQRMGQNRQSDRDLAIKQWRGLFQLLQNRLAIDVALLEPRLGMPDMIFTSNGGIVWGNKFIVSNYRDNARREETERFMNWFQVRGYEICSLPSNCFFEGDILRDGDVLFGGYHIQSDIQSHKKISDILRREVFSIELAKDWNYHLDTCFCPLGGDRALYYPPAFNDHALKVLENRIFNLIPVLEDEAKKFVCNAIVIGNNVVMNDGCPNVRSSLEGLGLTVHETFLSEFVKSGGSAKCLVLEVPYNKGQN